MGYSRSIRGVFMGYSYVSVMCRLCIGYLSEHTRSWEGKMENGKGKSENEKWEGERGWEEDYSIN